MSDKDSNDIEAFHEAMKGVKRITPARVIARHKAKPSNSNLRYRRAKATEETTQVIDGLSLTAVDIVESEEELLFAGPGVQLRQLKRLRRGHIPWQAGLDLHGYTVEAARDELSRFINDSYHAGMRCVLVVHGKAFTQPGQPAKIKSYVNDWLRQMREVTAFCSATAVDGGTGALYVLLKSAPK